MARIKINSYEELGAILASARTNLAVTQVDFAKDLGVNVKYLSEMENGKDMLVMKRIFKMMRMLDAQLFIDIPIGDEARGK